MSQQQIMLRQAELLTECTTNFLMVFPEAAGFVVSSQEPINSSVCHNQTRDQKAQHGLYEMLINREDSVINKNFVTVIGDLIFG